MTTGIFASTRLSHGADERLVVERREHDARDALRGERLHDVDLRFEIVFLERALPDDVDAELLRRLDRAGVDRFPELVRRALRDHRDARRTRVLALASADESDQSHHREPRTDEARDAAPLYALDCVHGAPPNSTNNRRRTEGRAE